MKIDLFRNKEIQEDENPYEKKINGTAVFDYVKSHIEFNLTQQAWICIDAIFANIWNTKIGVGGSIYQADIENEVLQAFKKSKMLLPDNDVKEVVGLILEYIEDIGGIID